MDDPNCDGWQDIVFGGGLADVEPNEDVRVHSYVVEAIRALS